MRYALTSTLALLCGACGANLMGHPVGDDNNGIDAANPPGDDAPPPGIDAPVQPKRVVYLSFEGEQLTKGTSDARTNTASWMQITSGTAPRYKSGAADRATQIQAIVDGLRNQLASFPITIVTDRPTTGEYMMIVFGGTAAQVGSRFSDAVQQLDCGDSTTHFDLAWISDGVGGGTQHILNDAVGAIGFGLGLTATLDPNDCMCGWDNGCNSNNATPCVLTEGITRDPNANQRCANSGATQDEATAFRNAFLP
jgi:hypothetical protein